MPLPFELPDPSPIERTALVERLLELIETLLEQNQQQAETIQQQRDEIARLKGEKGKPKLRPSGMEKGTTPNGSPAPPGANGDKQHDSPESPSANGDNQHGLPEDPGADDGKQLGSPEELGSNGDQPPESPNKRAGSAKRQKTAGLTIHREVSIAPTQPVPEGSRFKGYRSVVIQELRIETCNTRYRLEVWHTPAGEWVCGELPATLRESRFGPELRRFMVYQHHQCNVTQPLLHEQLREWGIDISVGQVDALLSKRNETFFAEQAEVLATGLEVSRYITVDDSGARHKGKNGYVTQIGNDFFAWFASTYRKSRINFLELLHAGAIGYGLNEYTREYWDEQGLPKAPQKQLQACWSGTIQDPECWEVYLDGIGIFDERHRRIATEGALLGGLIDKGFSQEMVIVSDGAGQFAILLHALCWVHAERLVHKLIPLNDRQRADQQRVRGEIWELYRDLKLYKMEPEPAQIPDLEARFERIFTQRTSSMLLNNTLKRLYGHKDKLLLVLKRPEIPLHTNGSENDIRGYVKWRKVSGGTRSDLGRQCRDAFASLKKSCRKLGLSFWDYLADRIERKGEIPSLAELIRQRAMSVP